MLPWCGQEAEDRLRAAEQTLQDMQHQSAREEREVARLRELLAVVHPAWIPSAGCMVKYAYPHSLLTFLKPEHCFIIWAHCISLSTVHASGAGG